MTRCARSLRLGAALLAVLTGTALIQTVAGAESDHERDHDLPALHATRGDAPAIVDAAGRQVTLREIGRAHV